MAPSKEARNLPTQKALHGGIYLIWYFGNQNMTPTMLPVFFQLIPRAYVG